MENFLLQLLLTTIYVSGITLNLGWVIRYSHHRNCHPAPVFWNMIIFTSWFGTLFTAILVLFGRKVLKRHDSPWLWSYGWEVNG